MEERLEMSHAPEGLIAKNSSRDMVGKMHPHLCI